MSDQPSTATAPTMKFPHPAAWTKLLLAGTGLLVSAFSLWTIAHWHGQTAAPLWAEPLQYDAAWAFVFVGAALVSFAAGVGGFARLGAAVPIVLGALRLIAYLAPGTLPVRPILANGWLPLGEGGYNDMSVLTALVFVVLGSALASLRPATRGPLRSVLVTQLASIALALALLLLFGAWAGGASVREWLLLTGGEATSGLLFLLAGGALLADGIVGGATERVAVRRWLPTIVWFAAFACVLVLWRALAAQEIRVQQNSTQLVAADVKNQIEREMAFRIQVLQGLAKRTQMSGFSADRWKQDAEMLLAGVAGFQAIAWAGDDYVARWVVPASSMNASGYSLLSVPAWQEAAETAAKTRQPAVSRLVELFGGGRGFAIFVPAYSDDKFQGLIVGGLASLASSDWLQSILGVYYPSYEIALLAGRDIVNILHDDGTRADAKWAQEKPIRVADAQWTLRVTPTLDYVRRSQSALPDAALALGTALATLLALCIYLFQTTRRRARELAASNRRLVADIAARRVAEQALRESEARTRLIIDAIKDCAIYMLDTEGRIATWNPGAEALNGYTTGEILGRPFSILYPSDRVKPPEAELAVAARQGWYEEECWHARKDGSRYCGDDIISAIRNEQGVLQGFSMITRDATQRIELRDKTERSRNFYFALFSDFPNLVWRSDTSGACDYLNQAWLEFTGREKESELAHGWLDGVHPEDRSRWEETFRQAFASQQSFEIEFRLRRADGSYGWLICTGRPHHDMDGRFTGYLCSCYDNTARRAMEDELKESEERLERIASNVPGMVFKLRRDAQGKLAFAFVSAGGEALTGVPVDRLAADAEAFLGLVSAGDRSHLIATLEASAAQLTNWIWSGPMRSPREANEKWINIRARPHPADDGSTVWDGVIFDDTANRLAQLEVERSREELRSLSRHLQNVREEEKAQIAREVHDELGSTLAALKMDLDWLGDHLPANTALKEKRGSMLKLVESAVASTRRIVTDLRPSILDDLGLAAALRWQAGEYRKHSQLQIHVEVPNPSLAIDRERALTLFRIFQETLTNVARHAKATEVWVELSQTATAWVLQVRDNGVGLTDADLHKPTSHGIGGMRERAQQFGGAVSVSSEPGAGTTLVVTIPRPDTDAGA